MSASEFDDLLAEVTQLLQAEGRLSYRGIKRRWSIDDDLLEDLKAELIDAKQIASDEDSKILKLREQSSPASAPDASGVDQAAERREITVVFTDLAGSTELSSQLDPEDLRDIVLRYQSEVVTAVLAYGGHVTQYLGDGVLIYFGYPQTTENDPDRALLASIEALRRLNAAKRPITEAYGVDIAVRIGIHSGPVVVGTVGTGAKSEEIALGATPNIAARLQGLAPTDGIAISEQTRQLLRTSYDLKPLGPQQLKGVNGNRDVFLVEKILDETRTHYASNRPIFGRSKELEMLKQEYADITEEGLRARVIVGEPGIGKSRLVEEIVAASNNVFALQGSPFHQQTAFHPLVSAFDQKLKLRAETAESKLAILDGYLQSNGFEDLQLPLRALLRLEGSESYASPALKRKGMVQGATELLERLAKDATLLLVCEDLHWVDPSTLDLISQLIDNSCSDIYLLLTCRPSFEVPENWHQRARRLDLGPLSDEAAAELARAVADTGRLNDRDFEELCARADGVPLFIEEITRSATNLLNSSDDGAGVTNVRNIPISPRLALMSRLDQLSAGKGVAQIASVFGREFPESGLAAIWTGEPAMLRTGLAELVGSNTASRSRRGNEVLFTFRHALIRDTAYESLLRSTRKSVHLKIAEQLKLETDNPHPELVAYHCEAAESWSDAIAQWQLAADIAVHHSAHVEAVHHLRKTLELQREHYTGEDRDEKDVQILVKMGGSLLATEGYAAESVGSVFGEAREISERIAESKLRFGVTQGLWAYHLVHGELNEAYQLAQTLEVLSNRIDDSSYLLESELRVGISLSMLGQLKPAEEKLEQSISLYDAERHADHKFLYGQDPQVSGMCHLAMVKWLLGQPDQAVANVGAARALAVDLNHNFTLSWAYLYTALVHYLRQEPEETREAAQQLIDLGTKYELAYRTAQGRILLGWTEADPKEGAEMIQSAISAVQKSGARVFAPYYHAVLAETLLRAGDLDACQKAIADGLAISDATAETVFKPELLRLTAITGPQSRAPETIFEAVSTALDQSAQSLALRAAISGVKFIPEEGQLAWTDQLRQIVGGFAEGFETVDVLRAKEIVG